MYDTIIPVNLIFGFFPSLFPFSFRRLSTARRETLKHTWRIQTWSGTSGACVLSLCIRWEGLFFFTMSPDKELLIMPHIVFSSFGYFIRIDFWLSFGEPSSDFLVLEEFYNDNFIFPHSWTLPDTRTIINWYLTVLRIKVSCRKSLCIREMRGK